MTDQTLITLPIEALDTALLDAAMSFAPITGLRAKIDFATNFSSIALKAVEDAAKQYARTANARKAAQVRHQANPADAAASMLANMGVPVVTEAAEFTPEMWKAIPLADTPPAKPKRARRTKAEMEAAKQVEIPMFTAPAPVFTPPPVIPAYGPQYLGVTNAPPIPPPSPFVPAPSHGFGESK